MGNAILRVVAAIVALQALAFLSMPFWPFAMKYIRLLPDPAGTVVNIALFGALVWCAAEISNRLVGEKKAAKKAATIVPPIGGMTPADLEALLTAKDNLRRVRRAVARIADPDATAALEELVALADAGLASLPGAPERLRMLRRPLGYHLPKVVELAEGLAAIHDRPEQQARVARIATVLSGLADQFRAQRDGLVAPDMRMLDIDIKLLESSLGAEKVSRMAANLVQAGR